MVIFLRMVRNFRKVSNLSKSCSPENDLSRPGNPGRLR